MGGKTWKACVYGLCFECADFLNVWPNKVLTAEVLKLSSTCP